MEPIYPLTDKGCGTFPPHLPKFVACLTPHVLSTLPKPIPLRLPYPAEAIPTTVEMDAVHWEETRVLVGQEEEGVVDAFWGANPLLQDEAEGEKKRVQKRKRPLEWEKEEEGRAAAQTRLNDECEAIARAWAALKKEVKWGDPQLCFELTHSFTHTTGCGDRRICLYHGPEGSNDFRAGDSNYVWEERLSRL